MNATINTESSIRKVAVIGAGVMGAGIAAHLANAGIAVLLLDIVPPNATERNVIAHPRGVRHHPHTGLLSSALEGRKLYGQCGLCPRRNSERQFGV